MDNTIWVFAGIALLAVAVATVYVVMKRRAAGEPVQWEDIGQIIRLAQDALGNVFTEAEVDAVARFIYHRWKMASDLYTEEQWVDLVKTIFPAGQRSLVQGQMAPADAAELRSLIASMRV